MFVFQPQTNSNFAKCAWYESVFTPEECDQIIALCDTLPKTQAGIREDGEVNPTVRTATLAWLNYNEEHRWLFMKIWEYVKTVNRLRYGFQLTGLLEAIQLTRYETGGHYTWHEDNSEPKFTTRKLSLVIQLSDPETYEGGDLVIFPNERTPRVRGTISFFPSFVTHKVEPVKKGFRYSLVAWVTGEAFR